MPTEPLQFLYKTGREQFRKPSASSCPHDTHLDKSENAIAVAVRSAGKRARAAGSGETDFFQNDTFRAPLCAYVPPVAVKRERGRPAGTRCAEEPRRLGCVTAGGRRRPVPCQCCLGGWIKQGSQGRGSRHLRWASIPRSEKAKLKQGASGGARDKSQHPP